MVNYNYNIIQKIIDQNDNSDDESLDRWINWFCEIEGHEFFTEVDEDFIQDSFNLYGIKQLIPRYEDALEMILSSDIPDSDDLTSQK
jgi:casein kinase II subunit beta